MANDLNIKVLKTKRIEWIDVAKGISIILVVYGHTGFDGVFSDWLKSFRMPFFFIVSGILFNYKKYPSISNFLNRRKATILRPYIIFSVIVFLWLKLLNSTYSPSFSEIYSGWISYALWFIPVLLMSQILYYYIRRYFNGFLLLISLLITGLIGFIFHYYNIHLWFKIEVVFTACFYYGIGNISKGILIKVFNQLKLNTIFIITIITFIISLFATKRSSSILDLCFNELGDLRFSIIIALSGTLFMICVAVILCNSRFYISKILVKCFLYTGKNSYIILAFHQVISLTLIAFFAKTNLMPILSSSIRHIFLWFFLLLFINGINNYLPWILGKNKQL